MASTKQLIYINSPQVPAAVASPSVAPSAAPTARPARAEVLPASADEPASPLPAFGPLPYLDADKLTERPAIIEDIDTALPWLPGEAVSAGAVFVLLINQEGQVDRVMVEESDLPPDIASVLSSRFLAARFTPGRLNGQALACAIRIKLQFHGD